MGFIHFIDTTYGRSAIKARTRERVPLQLNTFPVAVMPALLADSVGPQLEGVKGKMRSIQIKKNPGN